MSRTIDGASHCVIRFFREKPAALSVYWIYVARANAENVAWSTSRGLEADTGWSINVCLEARRWLVEHQALEPVQGYIRPAWRALPPQARARLVNFDHAEYYRPTGTIVFDGQRYPLLYDADVTPGESSEAENIPLDVTPDTTSEPISDVTAHESSRPPEKPSDVTPGESSEALKPGSDVVPGESSMSHAVSQRCHTALDVERGVTELDSNKDSQLDSITPLSAPDGADPALPQADGPPEEVLSPGESPPAPTRKRGPRPRDALIDMIAFCCFHVPLGQPLGKSTGPRCGMVKAELVASFPDLTPDELQLAFRWYAREHADLTAPRDPVKVTALVGEFRAKATPADRVIEHQATYRPETLEEKMARAKATADLLNQGRVDELQALNLASAESRRLIPQEVQP